MSLRVDLLARDDGTHVWVFTKRLPLSPTTAIFDPSCSTEGANRWRLLVERDVAPAGSAYATEPPGVSGDTARPNYVGPSGNGLVERMKAGESPWNQGQS